YRARFAYEHTPEFQAETLGRAVASTLATGKVQLVAWYRIHDLPANTQVIGDENNLRLGVLDESGRPKPALRALDFFHQLFAGGFCCLDSTTPEVRHIQSDSEAHVFEKSDGEEFVTAWLRTVTLSPTFATSEDLRREKLTVVLADRCEQMSVYNELGFRESIARLRKAGKNRKVLNIPLHGGELKVYGCEP
ncbi:MAG TPA: hypothetical protein VG754_03610, partial [Verrucomicrobiae bacterium]|nr:hypothetical protein [Verrucomicrobiae bacterium]